MLSGDLEYLMTSLPYLTFDGSPEARLAVSGCLKKYAGAADRQQPLYALLDQEAAKFLDADKLALLRKVRLDCIHQQAFRQCSQPLLAAFARYVHGLRLELKALRKARLSQADPAALARIPAPITPANPLEEELQLLRLQWDKLEALSAGHYASFSALLAYKLKLLLLLRLWSFDTEKGFDKFVQTTKAIS